MKNERIHAEAVRKFVTGEEGAEVTELAIVLALIVAVSILGIITLGGKVTGQYNFFNSQLP